MSEYICPHCKKPIYDDDALLCLYCGESLNRDVGTLGKMKYAKPRIIGFIVLTFIILAFLFLMMK